MPKDDSKYLRILQIVEKQLDLKKFLKGKDKRDEDRNFHFIC
jgi:hypothetical protein